MLKGKVKVEYDIDATNFKAKKIAKNINFILK